MSKKGVISIFLALLIMPIYSFAILAIDVVKISMANTHNIIATEVVNQSMLSKYHRKLFERYNLFALRLDEESQDYAKDLYQKNILDNTSSFYYANPLDFEVSASDNDKLLTNLENQILSYMNLKGPYQISKGVLNLVNITIESKKFSPVMKSKFSYENEYSKINEKYDRLKENLKKYNANFEKTNQDFFNLNKNLDKIKKISDLDETSKLEIKNYNDFNKELWQKVAFLDVWIEDIIKDLTQISENTVVLNEKLKKWEDSVSKIEDSDIKRNFKSEISASKNDFSKENVDLLLNKFREIKISKDKMKKVLSSNKEISEINLDKLEDIKDKKFEIKDISKLSSLNNFKIYKFLAKENTIDVSKEKREISKKNKKEIEAFVAKNSNNETDNEKNIKTFIDSKDYNYFKSDNFLIEKVGSSSNINAYQNIFNSISNQFPEKINSSIENYYLSLYIVDKFSDKLEKSGDIESEIEYILFGNDRLSKNENSISNYIFLIRFMLNSIYAYTNSDLRNEATLAATAIAGWTGFGVSIVRSIILGSMSFGESLIDLSDINSNKSVAGYKNSATWNLSISSLPKLLGKGIKEISNNTIESIYNFISDYSIDKIDKTKSHIDEFILQNIDGISQMVISEIISPIQTIIFQKITDTKEDIKLQIEKVISEIKDKIETGNLVIDNIKKQVIDLINSKIDEIINLDHLNIEKYFQDLTKMVENIVKENTKSISETFKSNLITVLEHDKIKRREQVENLIDNYLVDLGSENSKNRASISGLNFKYRDYLVLIAMIKLSTGAKQDILKRVALLINYNLKKEESDFDIRKMYIRINSKSKMKIDTVIFNKYVPLKEIFTEIKGEYQ